MNAILSFFPALVAFACGTTLSMGQTNAFHSGNPKIDAEIRQYKFQTFSHDLPAQIESLVLQRNITSLTLWVIGIPQSSPNEPDKLAGLDLQVWLRRNDGTVVAPMEKPWLDRGTISTFGGNEYPDSMVYDFARIPLNELAAVAIQAQGKLYCYQVDRNKWHLFTTIADAYVRKLPAQTNHTNIKLKPIVTSR